MSLPCEAKRADTLQAAIDFALQYTDDGLQWLRDWVAGDEECLAELQAHRRDQAQMRKPPGART